MYGGGYLRCKHGFLADQGSQPSPDGGMVAIDRRVSLCETSEGPRATFPETSLSSFGGSRDAVDEVIKIHNVKVTSSVSLKPSPDEGLVATLAFPRRGRWQPKADG